MIPKIIHYCWFGKHEKPADVKLCIKSWKKFLPDYKIIEWNEDNIDFDSQNQYVKEAYEKQKWAFVSDYVRLQVLYEFGGIYFDTDVEVFKSFDNLLDNECFFGFESRDYVSTAVIGTIERNEVIKEFMNYYSQKKFIKSDGAEDTTTNVAVLTTILENDGLRKNGRFQVLKGNVAIFPQFYFSSNDLINIFGKYSKSNYAHHHYNASWYDVVRKKNRKSLLRHYIVGKLRNILGTDFLKKFAGYE